jgi:hypothetical protein
MGIKHIATSVELADGKNVFSGLKNAAETIKDRTS